MTEISDAIPVAKYPRTPYCLWSPGITGGKDVAGVGNFIGSEIVITEKVDGSNVLLHQGQAYARSVTGSGRHGWLSMVRKHHAWKTAGYSELHFYGEDIYGLHSIAYDPVPENATYYLFAVRRGVHWLSWDEVIRYARQLDIPTVPVLYRGVEKTEPALQRLAVRLITEESALGPEREGIVIRRATSFSAAEFDQLVCKMVRDGHVQVDAEHWSRYWRPCRLLSAAV